MGGSVRASACRWRDSGPGRWGVPGTCPGRAYGHYSWFTARAVFAHGFSENGQNRPGSRLGSRLDLGARPPLAIVSPSAHGLSCRLRELNWNHAAVLLRAEGPRMLIECL